MNLFKLILSSKMFLGDLMENKAVQVIIDPIFRIGNFLI